MSRLAAKTYTRSEPRSEIDITAAVGQSTGLKSSGEWVEIRRARLENGTPYGEDAEGQEFVLRAVKK